MPIERARTQTIAKPWGVLDLRPWNKTANDGNAIGEIWYDRPGMPDSNPALLLKLLFTNQPLSIQVHPDDAHARSMGLRNGKTEVWYVLDRHADPAAAHDRINGKSYRCAAGSRR